MFLAYQSLCARYIPKSLEFYFLSSPFFFFLVTTAASLQADVGNVT